MKKILNIITIGVLGFLLWSYIVRPNREEQRFQNYITYLEQKDSIVSKRIDDMGNLVITATTKQLDLSNQDLLIKTDKKFKALSDRMKANNIKLKRLINSASFSTSVSDTVKLVETDTVFQIVEGTFSPIRSWEFEDNTISLTSSLDTSFNLFTRYSLKPVTYSVDIYQKRDKWYKPNRTFANISSDNQKVQVLNSNVFTKKSPKLKYVLTAGIGYSALYSDSKVTLGPTASIIFGMPLYSIYK